MTENHIGLLASVGLLGLAISCFFYQWGGRSGKWKRRVIGSLILAITINLLSLSIGNWRPQLTALFPALFAGFSLGYGADVIFEKIYRRLIYALCVISSGFICVMAFGPKAWLIFIPHVGVGLWSVWIGVKNPLEAPAEEVFVCASLNLFLIAYPFIST